MAEPFLQGESADSPQAAIDPPLCLRENQEKGAARKPLAKIRGVYKQESGGSHWPDCLLSCRIYLLLGSVLGASGVRFGVVALGETIPFPGL